MLKEEEEEGPFKWKCPLHPFRCVGTRYVGASGTKESARCSCILFYLEESGLFSCKNRYEKCAHVSLLFVCTVFLRRRAPLFSFRRYLKKALYPPPLLFPFKQEPRIRVGKEASDVCQIPPLRRQEVEKDPPKGCSLTITRPDTTKPWMKRENRQERETNKNRIRLQMLEILLILFCAHHTVEQTARAPEKMRRKSSSGESGPRTHLLLRRVESDLGRPLLREDLLGPRQDDPGQDPHQGHVRDDQVHLAQQEQRRHPAHVRLQALAKEEEEERLGFAAVLA